MIINAIWGGENVEINFRYLCRCNSLRFREIGIIAKTKSTFLQNEKYIFQDFQLFPARLFDNRLIAA